MRPKINTRSRFGETLQRLRKIRNFTQAQLAEKIGVKKRIIIYYENEATAPPSTKNLILLAKALGVRAEDLLYPGEKQIDTPIYSDSERLLLKRFRRLLNLPVEDQETVIDLINSLLRKKNKSSSSQK